MKLLVRKNNFVQKCRIKTKYVFLGVHKRTKHIWKAVSRKAVRNYHKSISDWEVRLGGVIPETAHRFRYDGVKWSEDKIKIKMESEPFANGKYKH